MHNDETLKMISKNRGRWNDDGYFIKLAKTIFLFQNHVEFEAICKEFYDSVIKTLEQKDLHDLLKDFIKYMPAYKNSKLIKDLLKYHVDWLNQKVNTKPVFSWRMPEATFPGHKVVEDFLRSDKEKMIYTGVFSFLFSARNFVNRFYDYDFQQKHNFSAEMDYCGKEASGKVKITKDDTYFKRITDLYNRNVSDLKELLKLYK